MKLIGLTLGHISVLSFFVAVANAYGPLPQAAPPNRPPAMDISPWIPIRFPKYLYDAPPRPMYGMRIPPTLKPAINPRPAYASAAPVQQAAPMPSPWMPIVPIQQPAAPEVQEMAVMFELSVDSPAPEPAPVPQSAPRPALPSSGRLPLVPLAFRNPSTPTPAVEPSSGPISSGSWLGPDEALVPPPPLVQAQDSSPSGSWPGPEVPAVPAPPPAQEQTVAPAGSVEPLGPPGTFLPLSGDLTAPVKGPDSQPAPPSSEAWPDTPKDVPGAELMPPLVPATFGQFAVPPAG